jgi:chromosome segregation ATPase
MIGPVELTQGQIEEARGPTLQERIVARRRRQQRIQQALSIGVAVLFVLTCGLGWRVISLTQHKDALQKQQSSLQQQFEDGQKREFDVNKKLIAAQKQLEQLDTDATGKDAVIRDLQADTTAKQAQIDSLTSERAALKGCLDGVTLALVQLTNNGSNAAKSTIDGVRDVCKQAEVLL